MVMFTCYVIITSVCDRLSENKNWSHLNRFKESNDTNWPEATND